MKKQWNKLVAACAFTLVASVLVAADTPRSEWLGKVGDCAGSAETMTATMSSVSASDQVALVAEVNAALAKMPGSNEQRAAAFVKANVAALKAAMAQNKDKHAANQVLAEIYATVPPEYLTVVAEQLSATVLKRNDLPAETFTAIAKNAVKAVSERCKTAENAGVREAFAVVTFLKASGDATKELTDALLAEMGDAKARETAAAEWIGPALGKDGAAQSYDPMLGAANAGDEPDHAVVDAILAGKEVAQAETKAEPTEASADDAALPNAAKNNDSATLGVAMLGDLQAMNSALQTGAEQLGAGGIVNPGQLGNAGNDLSMDVSLNRTPRAYVESKDAVGGNKDGKASDDGDGNPYYTHDRGDKPGTDGGTSGGGGGYRGQGIRTW